MSLSRNQVVNVCLAYGGHKCCRYLAVDARGRHDCMKKTGHKTLIDNKTEEYLKKCKEKGVSPANQGFPVGINCPGYPSLQYIEVGYDVKKN